MAINLFYKRWSFILTISFSAIFLVALFIFNNFNSVGSENFTASLLGLDNQIESEEVLPDLSQEKEGGEELTEESAFVLPEINYGVARQNILDDIQEKLDVIQQQVFLLEKQQKQEEVFVNENENTIEEELEEDKLDKKEEPEDDKENTQNNQAVSCVGKININTATREDLEKIVEVGPAIAEKIINARLFYSLDDLSRVSGIGEATLLKIKQQGCAFVDSNIGPAPVYGSGGIDSRPQFYPKILISEIQINPIGQRFIELYNPNSSSVDLTDWYLQRKDSNDTSWGSLISHTKFDGKNISANGYFLISREIGSSDIFYDFALSDNNSLALKNPNGDIADQTSFSVLEDHKSIGRKVLDGGLEQDTDNDQADFETDTPTPKSQNMKWQEPPAPTLETIAITTPANKLNYKIGEILDITGLIVTGTYSDSGTKIETVLLTDVSGFDSSAPATGQVLTITIAGKTTTYSINILEPVSAPKIILYMLQIAGYDPVENDNVVINYNSGVKIKINTDKACKFEIWINGKKYWYTTTFSTSISRPSSGCGYWTGTQSSCSGNLLENGVYPITVKITDESGSIVEDKSKTITIDNLP